MKFEKLGLSPEILQNLQDLKFFRTTDIQFKAIPPILRGEDVLAIAQTGTGKTAAFAIPVVHAVQSMKRFAKGRMPLKCLVMVPTRELAQQISEVFNAIARKTNVIVTCITGGVEQDPQIKRLQQGTDILVATPGRMFDLISQGYIDVSGVEILILDEADHMLSLGFIKDIRDISAKLPKQKQILFFSATIDDAIKKAAYGIVKNPIRIQISPENPVNKNITHSVAHIEMDDKRFFLERLVNEFEKKKILVFVRTKVRAERVHNAMERVGITTATLHGDKDQKERTATLNAFRNGEFDILVATDISARGIDIPDVDIVVNYDLPELPENYVHRVGRTGRGHQKGLAFSFCSNEEKPYLKAIEDFIGQPVDTLTIYKKDYSAIIDLSDDSDETNWQKLMEEDEKESRKKKR